jgi:hypothetical protein
MLFCWFRACYLLLTLDKRIDDNNIGDDGGGGGGGLR